MALANFFDRAATAASQVLSGFDLPAFEARLNRAVVGIAWDDEGASQTEGRALLELAVNLLARLYPTIVIQGAGKRSAGLETRLREIARSINPKIDIAEGGIKADSTIAVGPQKATKRFGRTFWAGSDGWIARLSMSRAVPVGNSANPFGAGAAACFAAANVFREIFRDQLPHGGPDTNLTLSLLNYAQSRHEIENAPFSDVSLGTTELVGVGAIGNAFIWAIKRIPGLRGMLNLIDHEVVELSNLQRYVLTTQEHQNVAKAELATEGFMSPDLKVTPFVSTWAQYIGPVGRFRAERVAAAVDSAKDRITIQASLPRHIFNSWTQTMDLGVSRHDFVGSNACLACLYLPQTKVPNEDELVAGALGISDRMEIRRLLSQNLGVDRQFLGRVATALSLPLDVLLPFENKPIRSFYIEAFCGGAVFRLTDGSRSTPTLVPMAFQSALAGIMLAGEVVADSAGLKSSFSGPCTSTINLLRPLAPYVSFARAKDSGHRCICQDEDYMSAYADKWGKAISEV